MPTPRLKDESAPGTEPGLTPGLFRFLLDLKAHNGREWFQANKARFEAEARDPVLGFIAAFSERLPAVSRHFIADPRPSGGSLFRIYRDTRFSRDKTPYKTHLGAHFPHRACLENKVHGPGFYLHLEPGGSFGGAGIWHPDPETLRKVREAILERPKAWKAVKDAGLRIQGEALKRVPQGFDPAHPHAEDLKLKDFTTLRPFTDQEVLAPDFLDRFTASCAAASPLMAFLCKALDLAY